MSKEEKKIVLKVVCQFDEFNWITTKFYYKYVTFSERMLDATYAFQFD